MTAAALGHAPRKVRLGLPLEEGLARAVSASAGALCYLKRRTQDDMVHTSSENLSTGSASDLASTAQRHRQTTR